MIKKLLFFVCLVMALAAIAHPAHAQEGSFLVAQFSPENGMLDQYLEFGETSQVYGFFLASFPGPPTYVSDNFSLYWTWTSGCLSGGIAVQQFNMEGNNTFMQMSGGIYNPFTGAPQGQNQGFAWIPTVASNTIVWNQEQESGGPCGPTG